MATEIKKPKREETEEEAALRIKANTATNDYLKAANTPYNFEQKDLLDKTQNQYLNRGAFNYDATGDKLYNLYKDRFTSQGKLAMEDTIAKASQLTGGYANSYATQVGQQTYNDYMQKLADKIPELEQQAYNRYLAEGDILYNKYNMLLNAEKEGYNRQQNDLSKLYNNATLANNLYDKAVSRGDSLYGTDLDMYMWETDRQDEFNRQALTADQNKKNQLTEFINLYSQAGTDDAKNAVKDMMTSYGYNPNEIDMITKLSGGMAPAAPKGLSQSEFEGYVKLMQNAMTPEEKTAIETQLSSAGVGQDLVDQIGSFYMGDSYSFADVDFSADDLRDLKHNMGPQGTAKTGNQYKDEFEQLLKNGASLPEAYEALKELLDKKFIHPEVAEEILEMFK